MVFGIKIKTVNISLTNAPAKIGQSVRDLKMRRINKKREKIFAVDYKVAPELLTTLDQLTMLANTIITPLINNIVSKGYSPITKAKIRPYSDMVENADEGLYQISIKAVFVGKKKAKETNNDA